MSPLLELAYRIDPVLWVREVLGVTPASWQKELLRARRGASILALTARQVGKTTAAAWAIAHTALFMPGSLSVVACPAQRQSAEAVRRVKEMLLKAGATLKVENVYALELDNGARVLALPGSDDSVRGLTVDGWIVADEAARLTDDLISALRPMRARCPQTRLAMLSTAWSRTDPFWMAWDSDDQSWMRLKATADTDAAVVLDPAFLEQERRTLGEEAYKREYLGDPAGAHTSPFTFELYERATMAFVPRVQPGSAFMPPANQAILLGDSLSRRVHGAYNREDAATWSGCRPLFIAHDVARSRDRSTAVVGGNHPYEPDLVGILDHEELPTGLFGSARASTLRTVDQRYQHNALIVADLSNDPTYAEALYEMFGSRVIGLQINRHGNGLEHDVWPVKDRAIPVYTIGRTYLFEQYHAALQTSTVRIVDGPMAKNAYDQLTRLEIEYRDSGVIYRCPSGQHDDLGISCAMLNWAARHPHRERWFSYARPVRRPKGREYGWGAFT